MAPYFTSEDFSFLQYLDDDWKEYPAKLEDHCELEKLVDEIRCNFKESSASILISENSISKKPAVFIHDYRNAPDLDQDQSDTTKTAEQIVILPDNKGQAVLPVPEPQASTTSPDGHSSTVGSEDESSSTEPWLRGAIEDSKTLKKRIHWPTPPNGETLLDWFLDRALNDKENPTGLVKDPACRLVFIDTGAPVENKLKVTEDMLLQILAYHQVSPCYLDFLSCIVTNLIITESDRFFGGFRNLKFFSHCSTNEIASLGRSSHRLQLTFALKAVFRPLRLAQQDWIGLRARLRLHPKRLRALFAPNGYRPPPDQLDNIFPPEMSGMLNTQKWPIVQAAIYHHFDVENGRAFWIIAAPGADALSAYADNVTAFKDPRRYYENLRIQTETKVLRFQSSLDLTLWLGQWSLSHFASFIDHLDGEINQKARNIFDDWRLALPIPEMQRYFDQKRLAAINILLEQVNTCTISLKGNLRVFKSLRKFYQIELLLETNTLDNLSWLQEEREKTEAFSQQLKIIYTITENLVRRAELLLEAGKRREDLLHRMLHVKNESHVSEMATATTKDSAKMKGYAAVTFFLLPMTVVSTFFATDVVKFQGDDTLVGKWSSGAGVWFIGSMIVLMGIVYLTFKFGESLVEWSWDHLVKVFGGLWDDYLEDIVRWLLDGIQLLWDGLVMIAKQLLQLWRNPPPGGGAGGGGSGASPPSSPSDPNSHPPPPPLPDEGSPAEKSDEREVPASPPSDPSTPQQQNSAARNLNNNDLSSQRTRSDNSVDANRASPLGSGGSTSPLLEQRSKSPRDLEEGIV